MARGCAYPLFATFGLPRRPWGFVTTPSRWPEGRVDSTPGLRCGAGRLRISFRRVLLRLAGFADGVGLVRTGERPIAGLRRIPLERVSGARLVLGAGRRTLGDVLGDASFRRGRIVGLGLEELRPSLRLGDTRTAGDVRRLGDGRRVEPI